MSVTGSLPAEIIRLNPTPPARQAAAPMASIAAPLCAIMDTPPDRREKCGSMVRSSFLGTLM